MLSQSNHLWIPVTLLILLIVVAGFVYANRPTGGIPEQTVAYLSLEGPVANPDAELSGLAWYGETLILLPQYPERFGEGDGVLFALPKADVLSALDATHTVSLDPAPVALIAPGLKESIPNFQGYEAIGFHEDQVFLTVEAGEGLDMHGYIVSGAISPDLGKIELDTSNVVEIPLPIQSENHSDEALVVLDDKVLTFYEVNGANLNPQPAARVFDFDLQAQGIISMPHLEYRLTDAALDDSGHIWVINYFFPGDTGLTPKSDPLAESYGKGQSHLQYDQVERLVAFDYSDKSITLVESAPIQLALESEDANNWEGLVALDGRGFLLVTDKFPSTLLGFVEIP
ncbi:MAG: hypothetical protein ACOYYU_15655 [Chloroflexota bacterium]